MEHNYPIGKTGIKVTQEGPWRVVDDRWEWNFIPVTTELCDLCDQRTAHGQTVSCALHCLGNVIEYGPIEELAKKMDAKGKKVMMYLP
jgi:Fe-S-cluster-containing dehydrogenase component